MSFIAASLNDLLDRYLKLCSGSESRTSDVRLLVNPGEIVMTTDELRAFVNLVKDALAVLGPYPHEAMSQLRTSLVNFLARADEAKEPT